MNNTYSHLDSTMTAIRQSLIALYTAKLEHMTIDVLAQALLEATSGNAEATKVSVTARLVEVPPRTTELYDVFDESEENSPTESGCRTVAYTPPD